MDLLPFFNWVACFFDIKLYELFNLEVTIPCQSQRKKFFKKAWSTVANLEKVSGCIRRVKCVFISLRHILCNICVNVPTHYE